MWAVARLVQTTELCINQDPVRKNVLCCTRFPRPPVLPGNSTAIWIVRKWALPRTQYIMRADKNAWIFDSLGMSKSWRCKNYSSNAGDATRLGRWLTTWGASETQAAQWVTWIEPETAICLRGHHQQGPCLLSTSRSFCSRMTSYKTNAGVKTQWKNKFQGASGHGPPTST